MDAVVVTGANRGIGREIAQAVLERGNCLVMVCRSHVSGAPVLSELQASFGEERVRMVTGDLSSSAGVQQVAHGILSGQERLVAVVLNAALWPTKLEHNGDGHELSFAINHLGSLELSRRLHARLEHDGPSRLVFMGAGLHGIGKVDLERTPRGLDFSAMRTYGDSKAFMALGARALAARVEGTKVCVLTVHPGVINTRLGMNGRWWDRPFGWVKRLWGRPEDGARAPVALALDPAYAEAHGQWFDELTPKPWHGPPADLELAERVWEQAVELRPVP